MANLTYKDTLIQTMRFCLWKYPWLKKENTITGGVGVKFSLPLYYDDYFGKQFGNMLTQKYLYSLTQ